jgi:hypothetical protein
VRADEIHFACSLSYMEMRLVLARMIWNFDLYNTDGAIEWDAADNMKVSSAFSSHDRTRTESPAEHESLLYLAETPSQCRS